MNKDNTTKHDLQNTAQKTKDWTTRTPLQIGGELINSGRVSGSRSPRGTHLLLFICYSDSNMPIQQLTTKYIDRNQSKYEKTRIDFGWFDDVYRHFQQYFIYIMAVSFIGGENRRTWEKPPTGRL